MIEPGTTAETYSLADFKVELSETIRDREGLIKYKLRKAGDDDGSTVFVGPDGLYRKEAKRLMQRLKVLKALARWVDEMIREDRHA